MSDAAAWHPPAFTDSVRASEHAAARHPQGRNPFIAKAGDAMSGQSRDTLAIGFWNSADQRPGERS
jgi:hypothetical protein